MKNMLTATLVVVALLCCLSQSSSARESSPQADALEVQQIINFGLEFVAGRKSVQDLAIRGAQAAGPRSFVGTMLMSGDKSHRTILGNIKVGYKAKTAVFTAQLATVGAGEGNKSKITSGKVQIDYEKKESEWQFKRLALATEALP